MATNKVVVRFRNTLQGLGPRSRLLVVCSLGIVALAASAASAAAIIWQAGGKKIEATEKFNATFEKKAGYANFVIKTAGITITCTKQTTIGMLGEIIGGEPGKANSALELTGCTVTAPAKCEVQGTKQKVPGSLGAFGTAGQLVKNAAATEVLLLSAVSDEMEFINKGAEVCPIAGPTKLTGEVLGELKPQKQEETEIKLVLPAALIANYAVKVGCLLEIKVPTALKLNGEAVTQLSGETGIFESVEIGPP